MDQCPRCKKSLECNANNIAACACQSVSIHPDTTQFLKKTSFGCLCNQCLLEIDKKVIALQGESFPDPKSFRENDHYYMENGFFVFTEKYHMLRGYCCRNGCRHCPYRINEPVG